MPRSSQSSRSTSSSSGKIPLSCQSGIYVSLHAAALSLINPTGSGGQSTYDSARYNDRYGPGYTTTLSEPRSGYSSNSSTSNSSRSSKSDKIPLSISQGSSSSPDPRMSKTNDDRYYESSFLDSRKPAKNPLSCQKANDVRYYGDSSYYR